MSGDKWLPELTPCGTVTARALPDGPDEDYDKLRLAIKGALATARHYVRIVTPYFLPDATLISALNLAALRGVRVEIVLTGKNNLPYVHWATVAHLWQMLERGCHFWLTPPPFDHSKIMVVDDCWSLIGSANWDPRSLRLNFELNVECYDEALAAKLNEIIDQKIRQARPITLEEVDGRNIPVRLRDGIARLLTPYL
jgi:cardiolipin synthase